MQVELAFTSGDDVIASNADFYLGAIFSGDIPLTDH